MATAEDASQIAIWLPPLAVSFIFFSPGAAMLPAPLDRAANAGEMRRAHMRTKTAPSVDYENGGGRAL
jgi:hypothetical protein